MKRAVWVIVGVVAAYVVLLMVVTPTPDKQDIGLLNRFWTSFLSGYAND